MVSEVLLRDYQYDLPDERIARYPVVPRDSSKLLVYQNNKIAHQHFSDLSDYLPLNSFLVFNDTKVIPARVFFQKPTGAFIEIFLLHPEAPTRIIHDAMQQTESAVWSCMVGNKKRWKEGEVLDLQFAVGSRLSAIGYRQASEKHDLTTHNSQLTTHNSAYELKVEWANYEKNWVRFSWSSLAVGTSETKLSFVEVVKALGEIPLPPYLNRKANIRDEETYQTVYSNIEGAVAAPTAGLHFTENVFLSLAQKGINHDFVTLHVGAGTFQPVKVQNAVEHTMHAEQIVFKKSLITNLIKNITQLIVVGTTSMRSLESLYWFGVKLLNNQEAASPLLFFIEKLAPYQNYDKLPSAKESLQTVSNYMDKHGFEELIGETEIMIFPSYTFKVCKGLITNFHQPQSTLMLLVAAFVGPDWRKIYNEALINNYRFLSYGDSSLLFPSL